MGIYIERTTRERPGINEGRGRQGGPKRTSSWPIGCGSKEATGHGSVAVKRKHSASDLFSTSYLLLLFVGDKRPADRAANARSSTTSSQHNGRVIEKER